MKQTYTTVVEQAEGMNATGLQVPAAVVAGFGKGKKPPVKVTIGQHTYRSTVSAYGDVYMLPLAAEHRNAAGVQAGDEVVVTLELDEEPRTVDVPEDLAAALAGTPGARAAFDALSYSRRKEHVRQVESAKADETRRRRIDKIVGQLGE
ncbi:MAG TPA: YdeI/OmpD-associated family protein [Anaerolineae bacterium]|nr:YdeI/OmpD-associated family protein [Anaerolineae bacterium]